MFNIASEAPDGFDIRSRIRSNNEPSEFEPRNNTFINATTLINAVAAMQSSSPPSSLFNENAPEAPHSGDIGPSSPSLSEIQNLRLFSPPASPELFSNNYTKPPSTIATNLDSTCLSCGDVFDDQSQLHTCSTPSCTRLVLNVISSVVMTLQIILHKMYKKVFIKRCCDSQLKQYLCHLRLPVGQTPDSCSP